MPERARLAGDSLGVAVGTDRLDHIGGGAFGRERAGAHRLSDFAPNGC